VNRVAVLRLGTSRVDKGAAVVAEVPLGTFVVTPVHAYVIELADGRNVLVDTGMSPIHIEEPHYGFDPDFAAVLTPVMTPEDRLEAQLAGIGVQPDDISSVISTHLHFDHAGNNGLFDKVPIYVQRAHYEAALGNPEFPNEHWNLPHLRYELLDGDQELFPGVELVVTPGHAPAHQSLLVSLASGRNLVLTSDAIMSRENIERDSWSLQSDPEAARLSAHRLVALAEERDAFMIFGHDHVQMETLPYAPQWHT
jgi:N-acyl homoserine lactone hydrolase